LSSSSPVCLFLFLSFSLSFSLPVFFLIFLNHFLLTVSFLSSLSTSFTLLFLIPLPIVIFISVY
jgi:hypothetical protein